MKVRSTEGKLIKFSAVDIKILGTYSKEPRSPLLNTNLSIFCFWVKESWVHNKFFMINYWNLPAHSFPANAAIGKKKKSLTTRTKQT